MTRGTAAAWVLVHRWTGLVCTAFLLMLCVTGLPLIFHAEIDGWLDPSPPLPPVAAGTRPLTLDAVLRRGLAAHPGDVPLYMSFDDGRPVVNVTSAPAPDAPVAAMHFGSFDRRTGLVLPRRATGVTDWLLRLHTDLLLGPKGELFLGAMALVFVVALISGVVLYVPFMARLAFGTVRQTRGPRVRRLDRHDFWGVLVLAWAFGVGLTGMLNTLATPMTRWWQDSELAALGPASGLGVVPVAPSVESALARTLASAPGMRPQFIAFPGAPYAGRRHLAIYLEGATPLTKRLLTPAFVDARTGRIDAIGAMPWYMQALLLAQPLHFGDFAGLPMKLIWTALDLLTIAVLWTGLRLWLQQKTGMRSSSTDRGRHVSVQARLPIRRTVMETLHWPAIIAVTVATGLCASLVGDGVADVLGWTATGFPLAVLGTSIMRR